MTKLVQYLMSFYLFLADRHGRGSGTRWAIMGMAVKVAHSIGLREFARIYFREKITNINCDRPRQRKMESGPCRDTTST